MLPTGLLRRLDKLLAMTSGSYWVPAFVDMTKKNEGLTLPQRGEQGYWIDTLTLTGLLVGMGRVDGPQVKK